MVIVSLLCHIFFNTTFFGNVYCLAKITNFLKVALMPNAMYNQDVFYNI